MKLHVSVRKAFAVAAVCCGFFFLAIDASYAQGTKPPAGPVYNPQKAISDAKCKECWELSIQVYNDELKLSELTVESARDRSAYESALINLNTKMNARNYTPESLGIIKTLMEKSIESAHKEQAQKEQLEKDRALLDDCNRNKCPNTSNTGPSNDHMPGGNTGGGAGNPAGNPIAPTVAEFSSACDKCNRQRNVKFDDEGQLNKAFDKFFKNRQLLDDAKKAATPGARDPQVEALSKIVDEDLRRVQEWEGVVTKDTVNLEDCYRKCSVLCPDCKPLADKVADDEKTLVQVNANANQIWNDLQEAKGEGPSGASSKKTPDVIQQLQQAFNAVDSIRSQTSATLQHDRLMFELCIDKCCEQNKYGYGTGGGEVPLVSTSPTGAKPNSDQPKPVTPGTPTLKNESNKVPDFKETRTDEMNRPPRKHDQVVLPKPVNKAGAADTAPNAPLPPPDAKPDPTKPPAPGNKPDDNASKGPGALGPTPATTSKFTPGRPDVIDSMKNAPSHKPIHTSFQEKMPQLRGNYSIKISYDNQNGTVAGWAVLHRLPEQIGSVTCAEWADAAYKPPAGLPAFDFYLISNSLGAEGEVIMTFIRNYTGPGKYEFNTKMSDFSWSNRKPGKLSRSLGVTGGHSFFGPGSGSITVNPDGSGYLMVYGFLDEPLSDPRKQERPASAYLKWTCTDPKIKDE